MLGFRSKGNKQRQGLMAQDQGLDIRQRQRRRNQGKRRQHQVKVGQGKITLGQNSKGKEFARVQTNKAQVALGFNQIQNFARVQIKGQKAYHKPTLHQKLFKSNGRITPDKKTNQNLDSAMLSPPTKQSKSQRYLQEALLLSNRQNPKKESKEDEEK